MRKFLLFGLCIIIVVAGYVKFKGSVPYKALKIEYLGEDNEIINQFKKTGSTVHYDRNFSDFLPDSDIYIIDSNEVKSLNKEEVLIFMENGKDIYFINYDNTEEIQMKFLGKYNAISFGDKNKLEVLRLYYDEDKQLNMTAKSYADYKELYKFLVKAE